MDKVLERLKELKDEESRYAYADAVNNAFLTGQIKALREERDLTQEKLANLVGTKQSGISRWLNTGFSTCKVETLRKFAKAYGVRLRITFEAFGTLPADVGGFTKERLAPPKFEDDPVFKESDSGHELTEEARAQATPEGVPAMPRLANGQEKGKMYQMPSPQSPQPKQQTDDLAQPSQPLPVQREAARGIPSAKDLAS